MKTKSFSEQQGYAPFDWNAFLAKETYVFSELSAAKEAANNWVTCACGNQCAAIERDDNGAPIDFQLKNLGLSFNNYIAEMCDIHIGISEGSEVQMRDRAKETLIKIEERSAELLSFF